MHATVPAALTEMTIHHIECYVGDLAAETAKLVDGYGFTVDAPPVPAPLGADHDTTALRHGQIAIVLTEGRAGDHPATGYVAMHGAGVADIALATADARAAFDAAVARGARPVRAPIVAPDTGTVTATIAAFGDVVHTFVQRGPETVVVPAATCAGPDPQLSTLDHVAVCVPSGELVPTVEFYQQVLGFRVIYEERVVIGEQAMLSMVVQNDSGKVTLVIVEPDAGASPGQLDTFLRDHGGAGVQHLALTTGNIVDSVAALRARGVDFLRTPATYYTLLTDRLEPDAYTVPDLQALDILVDEDHDGQLFQIFARSTHPRGTFFLEVIQRLGARTFGSGNIKALYTAVELDHARNRGLVL